MSSKAELLFGKIFIKFLEDLKKCYPEYSNFAYYHNFLSLFGTNVIFHEMFTQFKEYAQPFEKQIESRDEKFFLSDDCVAIQAANGNSEILQEFESIRELYNLKKTTPEIKDKIWQYIGNLYKLTKIE